MKYTKQNKIKSIGKHFRLFIFYTVSTIFSLTPVSFEREEIAVYVLPCRSN